ncbi:MAG: glutathione S-transferase family protein [Pseudomonadota bacterium]
MPSVRLWYSPGACSLAPHILLNEIGRDFEPIRVPIREGAHLTGDFIRLNPKKRLPVLALDDEVITELPAIALAISHLAPEHHLMGGTPLAEARVLEWLNWLSGTVHGQAYGGLWRPQRFADDEALHPAISARGRKTVAESYAVIDDKLTGPHAVGGGLTAADAYLYVLYRWGVGIGLDMRNTYARYTRFAETLTERPSVKAALATEGLPPLAT